MHSFMYMYNYYVYVCMYSLESGLDFELDSNSDCDVMITSVEPGHACEQLIRLVTFERVNRLLFISTVCNLEILWNKGSVCVLIYIHTHTVCLKDSSKYSVLPKANFRHDGRM